MIFVLTALATDQFDPADGDRMEGDETWTQAGDIRLWDALELHEDPDRTLFVQEAFNDAVAWKDADWSPHIRSAFGSGRPHSSRFLLHMGLHEPIAEGTPILMVPGAGDNASRGFITMATKLDNLNRPVYALTFAHPHGDVLRHAEAVANAIAVIKDRTGAEQIDLVGHSKGGIAAAIYASHTDDADWGRADYESVGTAYRGDVRRLLLVATPLGGVDTSYRWPSLNLFGIDPDAALAPTSWSTYYPFTTANLLVTDDLTQQDMHPDGGDLFPGQRQLLRRQSPPLPGSQAWLGGYALQPDWLTTYEGGLGFVSDSDGIDAAIADGGFLLDKLAAQGVDPDIEVFLLAGGNPIMPASDDALGNLWADVATAQQWSGFISTLQDHDVDVDADPAELQGLEDGKLVLGEVTGDSDGLVFIESALDEAAVDARGAEVTKKVANLSHLDVLYASPVTGQLLIDAAEAEGPEEAWMASWGQRYIEEDTLGWMVEVLADPGQDLGDDDDDDDDDDDAVGGDDQAAAGSEFAQPCGSCSSGGGSPAWLAVLTALVLRRRATSGT